MAELEAAYQRIDELERQFRRVRGELEVLATYDDPGVETPLIDCLGVIDEALADRVVA